METSPSVEASPHRIGAGHFGDTSATAAERALSGNGVPPYHDVHDDGTGSCGDIDCPGACQYRDISLAPRGEQHDLRSDSREPVPGLLLSRDLHSSGRDLHSAVSGDVGESEIQKALPGFDPPTKRRVRKQHRQGSACGRLIDPDDEHVRTYFRRLSAHGAADEGIAAYRYQLRATLRAASRLPGSSIAMAALFRDAHLLGRVLIDDRSAAGQQLSKWTLAQRRSAIRSFATLMRPELLVLLGEEPVAVVDRALRTVAERIGAGYRLTGGSPRRRGGHAPTREDVASVLRCLGAAADFTGLRNRVFFGILADTGCRVNALRELDGANCLVLPSGRVRIYLHEKGKDERREVELSREAACNLRHYMHAFNQLAAHRAWRARVRIGEPGAVWRNSAGDRWGYDSVRKTLSDGCTTAGVPSFAPHALRRAFASDAASVLPRHVVALAGGWKGLDRLDDHYIQSREATVWEKLSRLGQDMTLIQRETEVDDASAIPV